MFQKSYIVFILLAFLSCKNTESTENAENITDKPQVEKTNVPFYWENATIYFMLTDRFNNGDKSNDFVEDGPKSAPYRGFMGGDIKGITQKIEEGYFDKLGVTALWMTPLMEQILGSVNEGTGESYPYHGYWTRDWTTLDKRFGTIEDLKEMVKTAHEHGIRVLLDVIINHTGPVTDKDPVWPNEWVRTSPQCTYKDYKSTVECTLVKNLPDIRTEYEEYTELPPHLVEKWKAEGRYDQEKAELDKFFETYHYPRNPFYHIIKWLTDYIRELGIDGFRVDTAKHTEAKVWKALNLQCNSAFNTWKQANPEEVLDNNNFYLLGEVYNYYVSQGLAYDYGDKQVNFYKNGFNSLINFDFKSDAKKDYEAIFSKNDSLLHGPFRGKTFVNYISSHDDGQPFDLNRENPLVAGTKLLLSPGGAQIYYGDETARSLTVDAQGDATLRSFMNWEDIESNQQKGKYTTEQILAHWRVLGKFRKEHPSIGRGHHHMITSNPYTFSRTYNNVNFKDATIVLLDANIGKKRIQVSGVFKHGDELLDYYSKQKVTVDKSIVEFESPYTIVLLGKEVK